MKFKDLKEKYKDIDINKDDDSSLIIGDYLIREKGTITLSRAGKSFECKYFSVFVDIAENRTVEQMDMFIQSVL